MKTIKTGFSYLVYIPYYSFSLLLSDSFNCLSYLYPPLLISFLLANEHFYLADSSQYP